MKKSETLSFCRKKLYKPLLAMKITLMLIVLNVMQLSASVYSQNTKLDLNMTNQSLVEVFKEIRNNSDFTFVYDLEDVETVKTLDIDQRGATVEEILDNCLLNTNLNYEIIDKVVIIKQKEIVAPKPTQQKKKVIVGSVMDGNGNPLPGVSVVIKGSNTGVATDIDGNYTLKVDNENIVLVFSFVGMLPQEIACKGKTEQNVTLLFDTEQMDEVVVTGYQTISKERATGSFNIINKKVLDKPTLSLANRLVGTTAGMQANLDYEGNASFEIRGQTSFETNSSPLVVVDGFPIRGKFNSINPNDVESVCILKDAAAASIWGARAANGVIVVSTKKATKGNPLRVEFSTFVKVGAKYDLDYSNNKPSSAETVEFEKYAFGKWGSSMIGDTDSWSNLCSPRTPAVTLLSEHRLGHISNQELKVGLNNLKKLDNRDQIRKYMLQRPLSQQYNLAISGSTNRMSNRLSLLYDKSHTAFKGNESENYMLNHSLFASITKWLDVNISSMMQYSESENGGFNRGHITSLAPYEMLVNPDGSLIDISNNYYMPNIKRHVPTESFPYADWGYNPIEEVNNTSKNTKSLNARINAGINIKLFKGVSYSGKIQYELFNTWNKDQYGEKTQKVRSYINTSSTWDKETGEITLNVPKGDFLDQDRSEKRSYRLRNQLNFSRSFNEVHHINFIAGTEISQDRSLDYDYARTYGYSNETLNSAPFPNGTGYPNRVYGWMGWSRKFNYTNSFSDGTTRYFSFYSNIAYSYKDKYNVSASYRTDASNFITDDPKYRYSPFWSVGAGWTLSKEAFIEDISWIDRLSVRATFGYNGNSDNSTSFKPLISVGNRDAETGDLSVRVTSKGNPTLRWEKTETLNFGIDYSLFKGKLYGNIDLYNKHGKDILTYVSIPRVTGSDKEKMNNAEMLNQGIELVFGTNQRITKDVSWNGNLNFSYNRNKVKKLYVSSYYASDLTYGAEVEGRDANSMWLYRYAGMQNMGSETSQNIQPVLYGEDDALYPVGEYLNGNGLNFMKNAGTRVAPYTLGLSNSFTYKNFDLSFVFTGVFGHQFLRSGFNYPSSYGRNLPNAQLSQVFANGKPLRGIDAIELPYDENDYDYSSWRTNYMDYMVADAWNVRLREVNLSYQFPKSLIAKLNLNRVVAYAQANDLLTIKGTKEDPRFTRGYSRLLPSYTFGFKLEF